MTMMRFLALAVMLCVAGCSKDDEGGKKRDKDLESDREDESDKRKKKRDRDDEDEPRKKKSSGDKERDKDLEDDILDELERYRDEACECKDATCAEKVNEDFRAWKKKMRTKMKDVEKPPERIIKRLNELDKGLRDCVRKHRPAVPTTSP